MPDAPPATGPAADAARAFRHAIDQDCAERGWTYQQLVGRTSYGEHHILAIVERRQRPTRKVAAALDVAFGTGERYYRMWEAFDQARREQQAAPVARAGTIARLDVGEGEVREVPTRRGMLTIGAGVVAAGLVEALDASRQAGASSLAPGTIDKLRHAVHDYGMRFRSTVPAAFRAEVFPVRRYVGTLLYTKLTLDEHRDLVVLAGWLSVLLGLVSFDLGDRAAALAWCDDAEQRGVEATHAELAAWPYEIKTLAAFYAGDVGQALDKATHGVALAPDRSVAKAKLTAHEMRAWAGLGNQREVMAAWRRHENALKVLPSDVPAEGVFGINPTVGLRSLLATAFLLLGEGRRTVELAREEIAYNAGRNPTGLAITQADLGLGLTRLGQLDEAAAVGLQALGSPRLVGSALARLGELDGALGKADATLPEVRAFHERYRESRNAVTGRAPA